MLDQKTQGFKSSHCADKNYFGCSAVPPTLSSKVIRNLGETLCKIPPEELTEEKLSAKKQKAKKVAIGPKDKDAPHQAGRKKVAVSKKKTSKKGPNEGNEDSKSKQGKK